MAKLTSKAFLVEITLILRILLSHWLVGDASCFGIVSTRGRPRRLRQIILRVEQFCVTDDFVGATNRRRDIIGSSLLAASALLLPKDASAVDTKKPFAPLETLLPAVRVKFSIDRAISLTRSLMTTADGGSITTSSNQETMQQLENTLLQPQNYVRSLKLQGVPQKPGDLYLDAYKPMKGDLPLQRKLIRSGDVYTWKLLKKSETSKEKTSEIRAALNAYTDALSFSSDTYLLNVDKKTRSNMVREDRLPDVKQVITSDMGMRYLYRNQVLTAMDDVKAELEFQLTAGESAEWDELLDLLEVAGKAMDRWFSFIDPADVTEASEVVAKES